jgi:hypothetical protein
MPTSRELRGASGLPALMVFLPNSTPLVMARLRPSPPLADEGSDGAAQAGASGERAGGPNGNAGQGDVLQLHRTWFSAMLPAPAIPPGVCA